LLDKNKKRHESGIVTYTGRITRFELRNTKLKPPLNGRKTETDRQVEEVADTGNSAGGNAVKKYLLDSQ
jgi:hypothetical protein